MSVVGGVFIVFALSALCYRSVVVHKNFSLCLRLVSRKQTKGSLRRNLNRHLRITCMFILDVSVGVSVRFVTSAIGFYFVVTSLKVIFISFT